MTAAAIIGDNTNYFIGRAVGPRVFTEHSKWLKREHLLRTQRFYEVHGGKTVVMARFVPIVRTLRRSSPASAACIIRVSSLSTSAAESSGSGASACSATSSVRADHQRELRPRDHRRDLHLPAADLLRGVASEARERARGS